MKRGSQVLNTKPTVSLKEANHKTVCFVDMGTETWSSLPGTQCRLCNSENSSQGRCCYAFFTEVFHRASGGYSCPATNWPGSSPACPLCRTATAWNLMGRSL
ncbi:hypothetical protein L3X38_002616 [Prunus dulcis]|uniref:Uncharacterized protein n=1 Tax=Prunus dulcis TaxID=3755 RepID=A0AAD4WYP6_PRUDU|nr:hypothetical protein L3X38_002616 [Prunus dulcis]